MATSQSATPTNNGVTCEVQEYEEMMWNRLLSIERRIQVERLIIKEGFPTIAEASRPHDEAYKFEIQRIQLWNKLYSLSGKKVLSRSISQAVVRFFRLLSPSTYETLKPLELDVAAVLETKDNIDVSSAILDWLEDREDKSVISSPRIFGILSTFLVCDKGKQWETRFLNLLWNHSLGVSDSDLVYCLSKVAQHYAPVPEIESQEETFIQANDKGVTFLDACSTMDIAKSFSFAFWNDVNRALNQNSKVYDEKVNRWAEKENAARQNWSNPLPYSKLTDALTIDIPITSRHTMAKECFDRLEMARHVMSADLNPHGSDTLASVISTVMSPEVQTLKALKNETELYHEAVLQVKELSDRYLALYEAVKKEQFERLDKFFQSCQREKEDVMKEVLYKKAKCLASIEKASISGDVKSMSSEDLLKRILQEAGGAFKEAEEKHQAEILEAAVKHRAEMLEGTHNTECALCYLKLSKKRKRACLDPCGHASACFDCATKAWEHKPNCPLCKPIFSKPIFVPAKLFF